MPTRFGPDAVLDGGADAALGHDGVGDEAEDDVDHDEDLHERREGVGHPIGNAGRKVGENGGEGVSWIGFAGVYLLFIGAFLDFPRGRYGGLDGEFVGGVARLTASDCSRLERRSGWAV